MEKQIFLKTSNLVYLQRVVDNRSVIGRRIALVEIKTKGRSRMEYTVLDHASEDCIIDETQETSSS